MADIGEVRGHSYKEPVNTGLNKKLSVDALRESIVARNKEGEKVIGLLAAGFKSAFWQQIRIELAARRQVAREKLETIDLTAENLGEMAEIRAEIKVLGILLNLEKAVEMQTQLPTRNPPPT